MNLDNELDHEAEQERQQAAQELAADSGEDWAAEFRPGSMGCHELLDRTALMVDFLGQSIVDHPACIAQPKWYRLARQATAALATLYQQIGAEHMDTDASPTESPS